MAALKLIFTLVFISNIIVVYSEDLPLVAGLFSDRTSKPSETVFRSIANSYTSKKYTGVVIHPPVRDIFSYAKEVCENTAKNENGVMAVIDARPTDGICDTTCLLCNKLQIAHLSVGWEPIESQDKFTFSYYPPPSIVSKAYATLIEDLGWDRFSLMYEDDNSFIRLQDLIGTWSKDPITFRKLIPGGQNRETFKYLIKTARISHHIIDCDVENINYYMNEIVAVENSTQFQSFILTNLDANTVNMMVPEMKANISTMHMLADKDPNKWNDVGYDSFVEGGDIKLETALIADALTHLEKAIGKVINEISENEKEGEDDNCYEKTKLCSDTLKPYCDGEKVRQSLLQVTASGFTGPIKFDEDGRRISIRLIYTKMDATNKFIYAGYWDSDTGYLNKTDVPDRSQSHSGVIRVISRKGLPYFNTTVDEDGSVHPRGYAVDLVTEIFKLVEQYTNMQFKLEFREVYDGNYGNPIEGSKKWNGIMGELMDHTADLGICDLTITSERNSVVDFSTPFMTTGISMLFKEPEPADPDMFSFIKPLSVDVWLYLATTYIVVSFIFLICARMSQLDWVNPHPCNQNPESLENIWSFYNCTWFAMGTIMTQGCDILPRGLGSRWIAGMWWFFAMIVTASYTANMSTFLSNSRRSTDIKDAKDLANQNYVSYGAVMNASTYKFFKSSNDTTYAKIWQVMSSAKPTVFTKSNEEGRDRVLLGKGKYAFFMESTMIKYYTERFCKLRMVGAPLDSKSYGIAMPKNFVHKKDIDRAIIELQETGKLAALEKTWWKEMDNNGNCTSDEEEEEDDGSLQMKNTSGIFLVLGVGGILGLLVAVVDFLIHANKIAVTEKLTFKEAVLSEWNASLNPRKLAKPAAPPRSAPPSSGSPSPQRERSTSRAVSVLRAATSFINFDEIY